jgi:hypothetical protein
MATASPATDGDNTFDNHDKTRAQAPNSHFPFPASLQRPGTGIGKFSQAGIAVPLACPSNAPHTSPSNCVIALTDNDRAASIEADNVERILAYIDAHRGNRRD